MNSSKDEYGSRKVYIWWICLVSVSIFNIGYILNFFLTNEMNSYQRKLTLLSIVYAVVCGIRSAFPKKDVECVCLFDCPLSWPIFGRSIATIAELCYIKLIILIIKGVAEDIGIESGSISIMILEKLFPFIALAQIFSWMGCLTKNNLWNASEESIWMITFTIITIININISNKIYLQEDSLKNNSIKSLLNMAIPLGIGFVLFLIIVDIPMYIKRWKKNPDPEVKPMDENFRSLAQCKKVSKSFETWKQDIPWQTGYFTLGVWSSIGLVLWYNSYSKL